MVCSAGAHGPWQPTDHWWLCDRLARAAALVPGMHPPPPSREGGCVALDVISRPQLFAQLATGATAWCSPPLFA